MANTGNTQQQIAYGASANDGTGDPLRTAFIKTDDNFDNIWLAGPVGSNITITNNTIQANNTNGNLILSPNGVGVIQTNSKLSPRLNNTYDLGTANLRYRTGYFGAGGIDTIGNLTLGNIANLRISGGTNGYVIQTDGAGNLSWIAQSGGGNVPIADTSTPGIVALGNGFTLNGSNQVSTSSLYNTNLTQPTQHYALQLDTNGVVILPDQSIINGSTLRAVAGSYAGLTTDDGENSWMWVDANGAYIATQYNQSGNSHQWTFDNTGNLTLPGNGEISINYANGQPYGGTGSGGAAGNAGDIQINVAGGLGADSTLRYVDNGGEMTLYADYLNAPGIFTSDIYAGDGTPSNITLTTSYGNATWTFNDLGGTVFPTLNVQRGDNPSGTIQGQTLLFGDNAQEAIISTPDGTANNENSQRLVINPGQGYDYGEGGDIYLWAGRGGDGSGSGGDIKIRGGQGGANTVGGVGGDGGYIRIEAGDSATTGGAPGYIDINAGINYLGAGGYVDIQGGQGHTIGGDANITGGYGYNVRGGNVNIWGGGSANGQSNEGHVNIQTGGNTWTFDPSGNLSIPGNILGSGNILIAPDSASASSYLDIYLTGGPDIHIASNDNSIVIGRDTGANVFVGNDGEVSIRTDNGVTAQVWNFDDVGNLTLPGNAFAVNYANGDPVIISGGTANTGNVTFSDQIVIGTGISNLVSGLYLAPSSSSANAVQYLRVRGDTSYEPTHIHFDTGNNQYFNQFIGDDNKYVLLSNIGNIVVRTDDYTGNSAQWTFGTYGELTLPASSGQIGRSGYPNGIDLYNNNGGTGYVRMNYADESLISADSGGAHVQTTGGTWDFDTTGNLAAPGNISATGNITVGNLITAGSGGDITLTGGNITGANIISATGNITASYFIGNVSASGNIIGGNISATGNITANYFIGNLATPTYGSFYDTTTQTNSNVGNAIPISYNTVDINNGVTIAGAGNTQITIAETGIYNIQFSLQVRKTDSGSDTVYVWLDKNGNRVANSGTALFLSGSGAAEVAAWNFVVSAAANDYYRLMWMSTDSHVEIVAVTAGAVVPAIPSVILTVVPVGA